MILSAARGRAFTLIEVIVTLAVIGIGLAVVGPALIVRRPEQNAAEVLTTARRAALVRGESVELAIAADGKWRASPARRPGQTIISGSLASMAAGGAEILISPLGVCTLQHGRLSAGLSFNPLTCAMVERSGPP